MILNRLSAILFVVGAMVSHSPAAAILPDLPRTDSALLHQARQGIVIGKVRVQLLSESLLRLEVKGSEGFEDRTTFHVVDRDWPGTAFTTETNSDETVIRTRDYVVRVPNDADSLDGVRVQTPEGRRLYTYDAELENSKWLPGPADKTEAWWFADTPRLIPPPWGLTPAPSDTEHPATSGWDLDNNAPDVYVFVPGDDYRRLRRDFLKLTGPTPMVPLFALGAFDSRWYDYSESTALQQIEGYRERQIPLDVLVVDTGWRQNASTGYQPNTNLFPNLPRFFREAHAKHVRVMFNDHPEPVSRRALDPAELRYRYQGLSTLLHEGLDIWWYDRNWMVSLVTPAPNLRKEVWGMREYHDMTLRAKPGLRPMIMANVDGIDNGIRNHAPDVAAHRFPIQWTGDIGPGFDFLRRGVENAVHSGVQALFPYMSEDLGGHTSNPTVEQYIRWIEYGALSPIYRPHCTHNLKRMPWAFGPEAERIARRLLDMRYRLLPVLYAAARDNYETGEPLLRRLDLDFPQYPEARRDDEYLIGKSILVAPVLQGSLKPVPSNWLRTPDGKPGLQAEYFNNDTLDGPPALRRIDRAVNFDWGNGSPGATVRSDNFSARWVGTIQVPESAGDILLATTEDDGARVWVDDRLLIDAWGPHDSTTTEAARAISPGQPHRLRIEYEELAYNARVRLEWHAATNASTARVLWVPPGNWINAWTGRNLIGPVAVTNQIPLDQIPIFIRSGALLLLAPEMQYTGQLPWDPVTLDIYPQAGVPCQATLYEDDTLTIAYRLGQFRKTVITAQTGDQAHELVVTIGAAVGDYRNAPSRRSWVLRVHRPRGAASNLQPSGVTVDGKETDIAGQRKARQESAMPFGDKTGAPDGQVFEFTLPANQVTEEHRVRISFGSPGDR